MKYKVMIVEDQTMPRQLFELRVQASERFEVAISIDNAALADVYCLRFPVDLILMDVITRDGENGLDAAARIKRAFPQIKIIIVTSMPEAGYLDRAREAKVDSFWYKEISPEELINVMDRTMHGERLFPMEKPTVKLGQATSADLTEGEIRVLRQVMEGLEYDEIAKALHISRSTVNYHISNILSKTGYANKTLLAIAVAKKQFIIPSIGDEE